jgi:hypothetical protein
MLLAKLVLIAEIELAASARVIFQLVKLAAAEDADADRNVIPVIKSPAWIPESSELEICIWYVLATDVVRVGRLAPPGIVSYEDGITTRDPHEAGGIAQRHTAAAATKRIFIPLQESHAR